MIFARKAAEEGVGHIDRNSGKELAKRRSLALSRCFSHPISLATDAAPHPCLPGSLALAFPSFCILRGPAAALVLSQQPKSQFRTYAKFCYLLPAHTHLIPGTSFESLCPSEELTTQQLPSTFMPAQHKVRRKLQLSSINYLYAFLNSEPLLRILINCVEEFYHHLLPLYYYRCWNMY